MQGLRRLAVMYYVVPCDFYMPVVTTDCAVIMQTLDDSALCGCSSVMCLFHCATKVQMLQQLSI